MYHFVQYLYHFIFILLWHALAVVQPCLHNMFMVLLIFALGNFKVGATKPLFLDSGSTRGEGVRACVGMVVIIVQFIYLLNSSVKLYFLCLPNYLRTYSSALCQIRALEKAFKQQNNGQSVPKILVLNAYIWLARTNTHNLHILPVTMTCVELCWQTYLGHILQLFATFEPWRRHLRRVISAKVAENLCLRCIHLIG